MAPSITETLYALGLEDRLVGVTRFCRFPPGVESKARIGGYHDPNYEVILTLAPDLVILFPEHERPRQYLSARGIEVLVVNQQTVSGILSSITAIAEACGEPGRATPLLTDLRLRMAKVVAVCSDADPTRTLIVIGRDPAADHIDQVYISGSEGWYGELLEMAGGVNAYEGQLKFPVVSAEGILEMAPEVIIEMLGEDFPSAGKRRDLRQAWRSLPQVPAVAHGRVHPFLDDFAVIPGPRFILVLEEMARVLHPEVNWEDAG